MEWMKSPHNDRPMSKDMRVTRGLAKIFLAAVGLGLAAPAAAQSYIKTETIEYNDDLPKWVVGQVKRTTTNGIETSRTEFDGVSVLPWKVYSFNKPQPDQTLTYNTDGTLATASDGRDGVDAETTITLSSWKRGIPQNIQYPVTAESPSGATESAVVNDDGTIASVTDENGYKTCYAYDAMGRLSQVTYPSESTPGVCDTTMWAATSQSFALIGSAEYGIAAGHWKQTVSTGNGRKVVYFDAMWRPLVEENYDNASPSTTRSATVKRYDFGGHLSFQAYPRASLTDYADTTLTGTKTTYDALDRVTQVYQDSELGTLTTTSVYDTGFKTTVINPGSKSTTTSYRTYDQPTTDWPVTIVHPEGAYTDIDRDVFGKPKTLVRHNADNTERVTRQYVYDEHQQLCETIEPEVKATFMGYDAAGNLAWSAAGYSPTAGCAQAAWVAARRVDRTYDARNRLSTLAFPDGLGNQSWAYEPDGLTKTIITDNSPGGLQVINAYTYNKRRLMIDEAVTQPGWYTWKMIYGFNANGHLSTLTYPNTMAVSLAPNALGQPTQMGTFATGVSYYPNGALKQFTYGNGIVHTLTQNARGLPDVSKDAYSTTSFLNDAYDYDANGNVAAITDGATGTGQRGNRTMTYDGLDRLTRVVSPMFGSTGANYTYDVLDNLTRVNVGGAAARDHYYCYNTSTWQLTNVKTGGCSGVSVIGLGYDAQGNLDNKNGQNFDFDYGNRLRTVTNQESYRYDGHGRRVLALHPTLGDLLSQYSQSGQLMYQRSARSGVNISTAYIYLGGSLVASREQPSAGGAAVVKYQHTDALGSPVVVTDAGRNVLERNEYEPFGKVIAPATAKDGPGFTGHVLDAATGMNYMQQRYYDPGIGRFLSVDPVAANSNSGANFNAYWYANNNPYKFVDPDGRQVNCTGTRIESACDTAGTSGNVEENFIAAGGGKGAPAKKPDPGTVTKGGRGDRGEATGIQLKYRLKRYVTPSAIAKVVNEHKDDAWNWGNDEPRFIYTREVGWIDFKHVAVSGSLPVGAMFGELWEWGQSGGKYSFSSGAAEDANSNVIGANARIWQTGSPRPTGMNSDFGNNVQMLTNTLTPVDLQTALQLISGQ